MALNGTVWGSFSGVSTSNVRPAIEWSATQSIDNNTSTITATLVFYRYNTSWGSWSSSHTSTITIDGSSASNTTSFSISGKSREVLWTRTRTVTHNADGSRAVSMGASGSTSTSLGNYNFSDSVYLNTIPRASNISAFSFNSHFKPDTANIINATINRESTSFTHDIQLKDGSTTIASWSNEGPNSGTSSSYSLGLTIAQTNTLLNRMSNTTSRTLTLRVQTKSGSKNIGGAVTRNATAYVDSTVRPSATGLTLSISGTGRDKTIDRYIQDMTKVAASFTPGATGGASVSSASILVRRDSDHKNAMTINGNTGTSDTVTESGLYEAIATTKDSRGRTATQRVTFTVDAYSTPRVTLFRADRQTVDASIVDVRREGNYSPISGSLNPLTITVERRQGTAAWTTLDTITTTASAFGATITSTGNDVTLSYDFRVIAEDSFGNSAEAQYTVSTQKVLFDKHKDLGIGIGKIHERGVLDVGGETFFEGQIHAEKGFASNWLPPETDLNTVINAGFYYNSKNVDVQTMLNVPVTLAFSLLVEGHAGSKQTFTTYETSGFTMYIRNYYGGSWGAWREVNIDGTGGTTTFDDRISMKNNDGFYYNDSTNVMHVTKDGTDVPIIDKDGGEITGGVTMAGASGSNNALYISNQDHWISENVGDFTMYNNRASGGFKVRSHSNRSGYRTDFFINQAGFATFGTTPSGYRLYLDDSVSGSQGGEPTMHCEGNGWGSIGTDTYPFYRMYSYGFINKSTQAVKENVSVMDGEYATGLVKDLPVYTYKHVNKDDMQIGIMAEEAPYEVLNVDKYSGSHDAIDIYSLSALTLATVKENITRIETLEAENADLKERLERLENLILEGETNGI